MRSAIARFSLSVLFVAGMTGTVVLGDSHGSSVWKTDFAAAQAEARQLNRPLLVHFYGKQCPPCRKMENEVLNKAQVLKVLENGFVAVKVCLDSPANAKVQAKFNITSMPTDLIVGPDGKVLSRTTAYVPLDQYVATITRWDAKFAGDKKAAASSPAAIAKAAPPAEKKEPAAQSLPVAQPERAIASTGDKLVPPPSEPKKISEPQIKTPAAEPTIEPARELPVAVEIAQPVIALDGYCPVTLRSIRAWKSGSKEFSLEHDGQTFYFQTAALRDEFKADPTRYAPRLPRRVSANWA